MHYSGGGGRGENALLVLAGTETRKYSMLMVFTEYVGDIPRDNHTGLGIGLEGGGLHGESHALSVIWRALRFGLIMGAAASKVLQLVSAVAGMLRMESFMFSKGLWVNGREE